MLLNYQPLFCDMSPRSPNPLSSRGGAKAGHERAAEIETVVSMVFLMFHVSVTSVSRCSRMSLFLIFCCYFCQCYIVGVTEVELFLQYFDGRCYQFVIVGRQQ